MKRTWPLLLLVPLFVAGCGSGVPVAVTPEDSVNFGNVPVVTDMSKASLKTFAIMNAGTASLRLSDIQVKTLEGC